ncbi:MAG: dihydropyrimidine dehydrogenase, partial [Armatimonadetes bacterium]|nr:dihydropyrimidine dehydrogenase [Armatimonadota bacterium]
MEISPRQNMPLQEAENRIKNFEEVALGYTKEQAVFEAKRCLNCPKPLCIKGCPVEVPIPQFINKLKEGN